MTMKKHLLTTCAILLATASVYAESKDTTEGDDGYPITQEERKEKEIGSILGGDGVSFHPGSIRNESTLTADSKINKFLWQASLEMVDVAPLALIDTTNGVISTDWYSDKNKPKASMKMTAKIVGDTIAPESINVTLQQRTMKDGRWVEDSVKSRAASDMEAKIVTRARDLFIKNKK